MEEVEKKVYTIAVEVRKLEHYTIEAENEDEAIRKAMRDARLDYDDAEYYDSWEE
ncbi:MAG: hypothetical protein KBT03_00380 [Bacteroidales bacterium]|nr:hypothetical protein [Candidatus Scybalousia scybalohippi]